MLTIQLKIVKLPKHKLNFIITFLCKNMFPVRCFTCNACVGKHELKYETLLKQSVPIEEIFKILKIERYCCRRMFLGHVNVIDKLLLYSDIKVNTL
jgi:DNA-directed RNA polymerase subunit N (RpoN/RPB10)